MNDKFVSLIESTQASEVVTSFGAVSDTRLPPRVVTAIYRVLESIMMYPLAQK